MRRCDEAGGLGGSGGWIGGCPYGKRGGYSWEIVFEPSFYEDEHNTETGAYQPDGTGHRYVDEAPLSRRRTTNLGATVAEAVEAVEVVEVDVATSTLRLNTLPQSPVLRQGMVLTVDTGQSRRRFTLKQFKAPSSFVVAETIGLEVGGADGSSGTSYDPFELVNAMATVTTSEGRQALWSKQVTRRLLSLPSFNVPLTSPPPTVLSVRKRPRCKPRGSCPSLCRLQGGETRGRTEFAT